MLNTSHALKQTIFVLLIVILSLQDCPANTRLSSFFSRSISLQMMRQQRPSFNGPQGTLFYLFNYPSQLLQKNAINNINSLISIQKLQIQGIDKTIDYKIRRKKSLTNQLITVQSSNQKWRNIQIMILLFNKIIYPNIIFGSQQVINNEGRVSFQINAKIPESFTLNQAKSIAFLNGINIMRKNQLDFTYQFSINNVIDVLEKQVTIKINFQNTCQVKQISVNYVVSNEDQKNLQIYNDYITFQNTKNNQINLQYLGSNFDSYDYFIFGLNAIQLKKGPGVFSLGFSFRQKSQNILQLKSSDPIKNLKLAVFRIGNSADKLCKDCTLENKIQLAYPNTFCVIQCPKNEILGKDQKANVQKCLLCPQQLNYVFGSNKCQCMNGYFNYKGLCTNQTATFSKSTSDCLQPNTERKASGICACREGYEKKMVYNTYLCQSICINGYYESKKCVYCPQGTFVNSDNMCKICVQNCGTCESQFTCTTCISGFQRNIFGQCTQVCGDGRIFFDQCDDGNKINGDGCSQNCKIQDFYQCKKQRQSTGFRSICSRPYYKIVNTQKKYEAGNLVISYEIFPPFLRKLSQQQITNIFKIKYLKNPPYQSYYNQDSQSLGILRHVGVYVVIPPTGYGPQIETQISLPNIPVFIHNIKQRQIKTNNLLNTLRETDRM